MRFQLIVLFALVLVANQKLMFVVEMFRHGARGPVVDFFYDAAQQSYQFDQLTATGQRQHYMLGKQLRKEYIID